eukprot:4416561-Prymnesium_polylepis.1
MSDDIESNSCVYTGTAVSATRKDDFPHQFARADLASVRTVLPFRTTTPACHSTKPVFVLRSVPFMLTCGRVGSSWCFSQHQPSRLPGGSCAGAKHISRGQKTNTLHGMKYGDSGCHSRHRRPQSCNEAALLSEPHLSAKPSMSICSNVWSSRTAAASARFAATCCSRSHGCAFE